MMDVRATSIATVILMLVASSGCGSGEHPGNPVTPTRVDVAPVPLPFVPIPTLPITPPVKLEIGEAVDAAVTARHPPCDSDVQSDAPDPCVRFVIMPSSTGTLRVTVTWSSHVWLALRLSEKAYPVAQYSNIALQGSLPVIVGIPVIFSVGLHADGDETAFRVNTRLIPTP